MMNGTGTRKRVSMAAITLTTLVAGAGLPTARTQDTRSKLGARLQHDVSHLAVNIGPRYHKQPLTLTKAINWLDTQLEKMGYEPRHQVFKVEQQAFTNLEVTLPGSGETKQTVVVGAHYDTCGPTPGADDNGSGVAILLELARHFRDKKLDLDLRLVFFANEEPPFFGSEHMGSHHYARWCREQKIQIRAMIALESLGYYSDEEGSQKYPEPLSQGFPTKGNFVAFVGDLPSKSLVEQSRALFAKAVDFPAQAVALPASIVGIDWSDHASFWKEGYRAFMVTDTAPFRNPHYHQKTDTPETLSYDRMARMTQGLQGVIAGLVRE